MRIRAYIAKDLSNEKNWPDGVHYETVRDRIAKEKHIEITFQTRHKNPEDRTVYLPYHESQRIMKALEFYDDYLNGKFKIQKTKKVKTTK